MGTVRTMRTVVEGTGGAATVEWGRRGWRGMVVTMRAAEQTTNNHASKEASGSGGGLAVRVRVGDVDRLGLGHAGRGGDGRSIWVIGGRGRGGGGGGNAGAWSDDRGWNGLDSLNGLDGLSRGINRLSRGINRLSGRISGRNGGIGGHHGSRQSLRMTRRGELVPGRRGRERKEHLEEEQEFYCTLGK